MSRRYISDSQIVDQLDEEHHSHRRVHTLPSHCDWTRCLDTARLPLQSHFVTIRDFVCSQSWPVVLEPTIVTFTRIRNHADVVYVKLNLKFADSRVFPVGGAHCSLSYGATVKTYENLWAAKTDVAPILTPRIIRGFLFKPAGEVAFQPTGELAYICGRLRKAIIANLPETVPSLMWPEPHFHVSWPTVTESLALQA